MSQKRRILFVCLGNICRSPLAEGIFRQLLADGDEAGYTVDSAGTSAFHAGEPADPRSIEVGARNGVAVTSRARQVEREDFDHFDLLIAMDAHNRQQMMGICPPHQRVKLRLMRDWDPHGPGDVPDPYYGGASGFDDNFAMLLRSCRALLAELQS